MFGAFAVSVWGLTMNWSIVWGLAPVVLLIVVAVFGIRGGAKLRPHDPADRAKPTKGITFLGR
jgi:heme/copper-type cytochrome/quinol oxidase subunit 2